MVLEAPQYHVLAAVHLQGRILVDGNRELEVLFEDLLVEYRHEVAVFC